uniref:Nitroreductase domain-containing protein n=1 Tax=Schistocephalus solidus TaxID=70667 RepID=A0A183T832_SCHSO
LISHRRTHFYLYLLTDRLRKITCYPFPPLAGLYRRWNLNLPPRLHNREDLVDHVLDSPLTQIGVFVAAASGKALAEAGVRFCACYASPALRCVQTACELLHASDQVHLSVLVCCAQAASRNHADGRIRCPQFEPAARRLPA